ncbi:hypothetical protein A7C99_3170 [Trichophyton rubrum]|uniref:Uncharacterized protein n=1 Tax=Trichophyton rubrum TaxID=5551 RepID=A0A178F219_TRIRU|nr:hypothetical protein A7C99_3170 [Trichophyton rubrum]
MGSIFSGHASYTPLWHSDPTPDYWSSSIGDDAHSIVPVSEQERLEDIIGISLERTCYGFAPSQGRRCRNPIARHSLNIASRLLNLGNEQLCNGHDISQTLERLVPLSFAGDIINTRPQLYPSGGQRRSLLHWRKDNPPMLSLLALLSHSGSQRMLASLRPDEFVLQYHQGVRTPWMNHGDYSWPEVEEEEEEEEESTTDSNDSRNATQPLPYASRGSSEQDSSGQSNEEQLEKEETSSGDSSPEEENLVAYTLSDNEGSTASSIEAVDQVEPEGAGTDLENPNIEDHTLLPENNTSTSALILAPDYSRETPSQPILEQYISPSVDSSLAGTYSHATTQTEISIPQFINRDDKDDDPDHDLFRSLGDFSKLPFEIRELIWLEFFPAGQKKEPEAQPITAQTSAEVDLRVLRASKGLYNEISHVIYSKTHISFDPSFSHKENETLWATIRFKRRVRRHIIDHGALFRLENSSSKRDTRFDNFPFDKVASIEIDVSRLPRCAGPAIQWATLIWMT